MHFYKTTSTHQLCQHQHLILTRNSHQTLHHLSLHVLHALAVALLKSLRVKHLIAESLRTQQPIITLISIMTPTALYLLYGNHCPCASNSSNVSVIEWERARLKWQTALIREQGEEERAFEPHGHELSHAH